MIRTARSVEACGPQCFLGGKRLPEAIRILQLEWKASQSYFQDRPELNIERAGKRRQQLSEPGSQARGSARTMPITIA
jgi:hypothetical protein